MAVDARKPSHCIVQVHYHAHTAVKEIFDRILVIPPQIAVKEEQVQPARSVNRQGLDLSRQSQVTMRWVPGYLPDGPNPRAQTENPWMKRRPIWLHIRQSLSAGTVYTSVDMISVSQDFERRRYDLDPLLQDSSRDNKRLALMSTNGLHRRPFFLGNLVPPFFGGVLPTSG